MSFCTIKGVNARHQIKDVEYLHLFFYNKRVIGQAWLFYAMAWSGIPTLPSRTPSTKMLVLESVRVLKEVNKTLYNTLSQMKSIARTLKEYETVRAMNGVGDVLAPRW